MGRRAKPAKVKAKAKRPLVRKGPTEGAARVQELEKRLAEALQRAAGAVKREVETQEQQAATAEILRVISASPSDVQPVFDSIAASALRLCDAKLCTVFRFDGELIHLVGSRHVSEEGAAAYRDAYPSHPGRQSGTHRAILTRAIVHIPDIREDPEYELRALARANDYGCVLSVPMLRDGQPVGAITTGREAARPFTKEQIELVKTFADQAVIAIENVRLFNETKEALQQQTATSDILRVISNSPSDLQPVFDIIAERATALTDAVYSAVYLIEDGSIHLRAHYSNNIANTRQFAAAFPMPITAETLIAGTLRTGTLAHVVDMEDVSVPEAARTLARTLGVRSTLAVPMRRDGHPIGAIGVNRRARDKFSPAEIELLQTFADQAVIAIENVRLFTELQQKNEALTQAHAQVSAALDQQTATSDILKVISSSPTDVQPVFDAIVRAVARLCHALQSNVQLFDGQLMHFVAQHNIGPVAMEMVQRVYPMPPNRNQTASRAILDRTVVHVPDVLGDPEYLRELAVQGGWRSVLSVPMIGKGQPIGAITVARMEPGWFSETEIGLLQTFADQAIIAIENVRLFTELQQKNEALTQAHAQVTEALDRQTATAEILRVIASSPTDVQPVFDAIAESSMRLCGGDYCVVVRYEDGRLHLSAHVHSTAEGVDVLQRTFPMEPSRANLVGRAVLDRAAVHIPDFREDPEYASPIAGAMRAQSLLGVPMLRDGKPIGAIGVGRRQVTPFTDNQIALLKTFADQAVIAIQNVRLFTELETRNSELRVALEQQTATSEVLKVISRSTFDLEPVLATLVENATRLAGAEGGLIEQFDGEVFRLVAEYGANPEYREYWQQNVIRPGRHSTIGRAALERRTIHIVDVLADPEWGQHQAQRMGGQRSVLGVPMLKQDDLVGVFFLWRSEVRAFTEKEIELVTTFADQAVIAIENVRLFTELQTSNRDLTTALETQTATSDILRIISRSQTELQPVFDAIVESAVRLLRGFVAAMSRISGDQLELAAFTSTNTVGDAAVRAAFPQALRSDWPHSRVVRDRALLNVTDARSDPQLPEAIRDVAVVRGYQSLVVLPMLLHDEPVGAISVTRREPGGFTDDEIALLQTFADQAVIAIENVRLFTELQTSNRELTTALDTQTATADILRVISRSQTDVQPVFDTIVESAVRLLGAYAGALSRIAGDQIELAALTSTDDAADAAVRAAFPQSLQSGGPHAQAIRDRAPLNIADAHTDSRVPEAQRAVVRGRGYRSWALVPMLRRDEAIGTIAVTRREPGGFTDDEIALLQTFADQAVIAIENARLLTELQARTQELTQSVDTLTALGEVGQAISSTLDLQTVLRTIVARATQLADADAGVIYEYDEQREIFLPRATERLEPEIVETMLATPVRKGEGATGRLAEVQEPVQVPDILAAPAESRVRGALVRASYRALLAVPLVSEDHLLGGLTVIRKATGDFAPDVIGLLRTFATQSALAIQNARLFREIEVKSRELEVASQHKSEFLASMSHELRTPLNAIIGFSDVLLQGMFGEMTEKQTEYLQDILASGQHLLSLINDILDLSKIEAGRMELDVAAFDLPTAIDDALLLMRERAGRRGITLERHVDERVGEIRADQRKVKQVLLNLLSNAVKFTPEGGRIDVRAGLANGTAEISVTDTGIGIAPEDHDAVFEEFRQVGAADKKAEGTGLGLALCRKFVELHGGRIWVKSLIGAGSTFTFTLPLSR